MPRDIEVEDEERYGGFDPLVPYFGEPVHDRTPRKPIKATPFVWRAESDIPARKWLYGRHLLRRFLSLDIAAGGIGKSSVKIGEALAMATGRELYGRGLPEGRLRVWLYNLEDPQEETERRVIAAAKHFKVSPEDVGDRLLVDSGRDQSVIIAQETKSGINIQTPVVDELEAEIRARGIDVLIVDPFVSSHEVSENDNRAINMVARAWAGIADRCNMSINLVHQVRKLNGTEANADSARGAKALIDAARSAVVYNRMTTEEAELAGVGHDQASFYFRIQNDKANLAPPESAEWYRMNNVDLDNGDKVGVACPWTWPDLFKGISVHMTKGVQKAVAEGEWREDVRAKDKWVGHAIAPIVDLDAETDRRRISLLVKEWVKNGVLAVVERQDAQRKSRKFVEVGQWLND